MDSFYMTYFYLKIIQLHAQKCNLSQQEEIKLDLIQISIQVGMFVFHY